MKLKSIEQSHKIETTAVIQPFHQLLPRRQRCYLLSTMKKIFNAIAFLWILLLCTVNSAEPSDSVAHVRHLYPGCQNEEDVFKRDRLDDFNKAFDPATRSPPEILEAYAALLEAIKSSEFICTEDYVQLAYKVWTMGRNASDQNIQGQWAELKQRFNPKVFDLFNATKTFSIMSQDVPGYAIYATNKQVGAFATTTSIAALKRFDTRLPDFKWTILGTEGRGREMFSIRSNFGTYFKDTGLSDVDDQKWLFVPTVESLSPNSPEFKFRLHFISSWHGSEYSYVSSILQESDEHQNPLPLHMRTESHMALWHQKATLNGTAVYFLQEIDETSGSGETRSTSQQAKELYPPCESEEYIFEHGRLWDFFQVFNPKLPAAVLEEAYEAVLQSIITSKPVICTTDYIDLASEVFEAERNAESVEEKRIWARAKSWFKPQVFGLFDQSKRWRLKSLDLPGHALYATNRKTYSGFAGERNTTFAALMKFDSRFEGFQWSFEPTEDLRRFYLKSAQGSYFETSFLHPSIDEYSREKLKHKLIPLPTALTSNSSKFAFVLMSRCHDGYVSAIKSDAGDLPLNLERSTEKVYGLTHVQKTFVGSASWYLEEVPETMAEISLELDAVYPPCLNEQYLFEDNRLQELFEVFNDKLDPTVLQDAYGAILDTITLSPFVCTQDYVQLAFKVAEGAKRAVTSEESQNWAKLKLRFNPKVFELFDETKKWRIAAVAHKEGNYSLYATGKQIYFHQWSPHKSYVVLKKYDDRLQGFNWNFEQQKPGQYFRLKSARNGYFSSGSAYYKCDEVDQDVYEDCQKSLYDDVDFQFVPTVESLAPDASVFQFKLVNDKLVSSTENAWYHLPLYMESDIALGSSDHTGFEKQGLVYYLEESTKTVESRNTDILDQVAQLYPPCTSEEHTLEPQRLDEFFEVFNARVDSLILNEAYKTLLDKILDSKPFICTQDYVQLAYKLQELERKTNTSAVDHELNQRLRSRFNPRVFDLFDETRSWMMSSAMAPNYSLAVTDESHHTGYSDNASIAVVRKIDGDELGTAFKWTIKAKMDGALYQFQNENGMYFNGEYLTPSRSIGSYLLVVPSAESVAPSSGVFNFKVARDHLASAIATPEELRQHLIDAKHEDEYFGFKRVSVDSDGESHVVFDSAENIH